MKIFLRGKKLLVGLDPVTQNKIRPNLSKVDIIEDSVSTALCFGFPHSLYVLAREPRPKKARVIPVMPVYFSKYLLSTAPTAVFCFAFFKKGNK